MTDMSDDELRSLLSRIDPAPAGSPVDPVTSPRAQELVERTMQTLDVPPTDELAERRRRRPWLLAAAAAVLVAALVTTVVALSGGGRVGDTPGDTQDPTVLALDLPASSGVAGSCIQFDVQFLAQMPVAFAGTVTAVDEGTVTLDVDHWYRGGDADLVTVAIPAQQTSAALDGVDFESGQRYLVTATDGTVNGCGYSGPATPELESAFDQAFGG